MKKQKFAEMRYGQWFKIGDQVWVKLQNVLPSGIRVEYHGFVAEDWTLDHLSAKKGDRTSKKPFNAVGVEGIPGCVPDWLECVLIKSPFLQRHCGKQGSTRSKPSKA
jgi:hypothetical protein